MKHVAAHYDGEKVVLDEPPLRLPADTPLEVVIPDSEEAALSVGEYFWHHYQP